MQKCHETVGSFMPTIVLTGYPRSLVQDSLLSSPSFSILRLSLDFSPIRGLSTELSNSLMSSAQLATHSVTSQSDIAAV